MSWLELKYVHLLSNQLDKFKAKKSTLFQCRCPICGDSKKNKNKTRGYIFERKGEFWYHCHNCGISLPFHIFLKRLDYPLYEQYLYERLQEHQGERFDDSSYQPPKKPKAAPDPFSGLTRLSDLRLNHYARTYLKKRHIPDSFLNSLYYCQTFKKFVNSLIPNKYSSTVYEEARIIIPLITRNGTIIGFQGRSLDPRSMLRYITIILDENLSRIYGLERINFNKRYYVLEGPFDSMFLENAIAVCGSDVISALDKINADKELAVIVYDNEPRNKEIVAKMEKAIKDGWQICIWPHGFEYKDVNDSVVGGLKPAEIENIIYLCIHQGLEAQLAFGDWKRT